MEIQLFEKFNLLNLSRANSFKISSVFSINSSLFLFQLIAELGCVKVFLS